MRTVEQYLQKAEAFARLAEAATDDLLRASYLELARGYRHLAAQRRGLLASGTVQPPVSDRDGNAEM